MQRGWDWQGFGDMMGWGQPGLWSGKGLGTGRSLGSVRAAVPNTPDHPPHLGPGTGRRPSGCSRRPRCSPAPAPPGQAAAAAAMAAGSEATAARAPGTGNGPRCPGSGAERLAVPARLRPCLRRQSCPCTAHPHSHRIPNPVHIHSQPHAHPDLQPHPHTCLQPHAHVHLHLPPQPAPGSPLTSRLSPGTHFSLLFGRSSVTGYHLVVLHDDKPSLKHDLVFALFPLVLALAALSSPRFSPGGCPWEEASFGDGLAYSLPLLEALKLLTCLNLASKPGNAQKC